MTISLLPAALRLAEQRGAKIPEGLEFGLRSVQTSLYSSHGFRWPFPGRWAKAAGPFTTSSDPCPSAPGDGLCVGLSWVGMASGGLPANTILLVGYKPADVLAQSADKLRAKRVFVVDLFAPAELLAERSAAEWVNLRGADLRGADLRGAALYGADLQGAWNIPKYATQR